MPRARINKKPLQHIRREDECEITFCGILTDYCVDTKDDSPIGVAYGGIATYADHTFVEGFTSCDLCRIAYEGI